MVLEILLFLQQKKDKSQTILFHLRTPPHAPAAASLHSPKTLRWATWGSTHQRSRACQGFTKTPCYFGTICDLSQNQIPSTNAKVPKCCAGISDCGLFLISGEQFR